ncbi:MAG: mechanosensitive ion channel [Balneolaceae bacterium]
MNEIVQSFEFFFDSVKQAAPEITVSFIVLLIFISLGLATGRTLKNILERTSTSPKRILLIRRIARWIFYSVGIIIALQIMGLTKAASGILAAGGVITVVLGFAFREIGENLLAGLFMSFSRSFDVGDLVESNGILGVVKAINIRDVHVRAGDGIDIFIPSAIIFKNPLNNYTRDGLRRGKFTIGIDFRNDSKQARLLILESIKKIEGVLEEPAPNVQVSIFADNYIQLEIFFWINTFSAFSNLGDIKTVVMESTKEVLLDQGFTVSSEVSTAVELLKN